MGISKLCLIMGLTILPVALGAVGDYFPRGYFSPDRTPLNWSHGASSYSEMSSILDNPNIQMIEVDVVMGKTEASNSTVPIIVSNPSEFTSDLRLGSLLIMLRSHNSRMTLRKRKGIKLNLWEPKAVTEGMYLVGLYIRPEDDLFPVWIHANVLQGPVNASSQGIVNGTVVIQQQASRFPVGTLSLGWTTRFEEGCNYSKEYFDEMSDLIKDNNARTHVTFPLRAKLAFNSVENILEFLDQSGINRTSPFVTFVEEEVDPRVEEGELEEFLGKIGADRVFVDLPFSFPTPDPEDESGTTEKGSGSGVRLVINRLMVLGIFLAVSYSTKFMLN